MSGVKPLLNVVLIGSEAVGKTRLADCLLGRPYSKVAYMATKGSSFQIRESETKDSPYSLKIWDTAGRDDRSSSLEHYKAGVDSLIVCCDPLDPEFTVQDNLAFWIRQSNENRVRQTTPIVIAITKQDEASVNTRLYKKNVEAIREYAAQMEGRSVVIVECSAKTGVGVDKLLAAAVAAVPQAASSDSLAETKVPAVMARIDALMTTLQAETQSCTVSNFFSRTKKAGSDDTKKHNHAFLKAIQQFLNSKPVDGNTKMPLDQYILSLFQVDTYRFAGAGLRKSRTMKLVIELLEARELSNTDNTNEIKQFIDERNKNVSTLFKLCFK